MHSTNPPGDLRVDSLPRCVQDQVFKLFPARHGLTVRFFGGRRVGYQSTTGSSLIDQFSKEAVSWRAQMNGGVSNCNRRLIPQKSEQSWLRGAAGVRLDS